jgi:hypothetical protein
MKNLLLIALFLTMVVGSGFAQPQRDPAAQLQREIEGLTTALGLSAEDVAKVTPIVTEGMKKQTEMFTKMRESGSMDREKMMEERTKLQTETDKALKAVLSADQGVKLDAYRKQQEEERAKRMQGR